MSGTYSYQDYVELGGVRDRIAVDLPIGTGARILDVGTGNGMFAFALCRAVPGSTALGIDIVEAYIADARARAQHVELAARCTFDRRDLLELDAHESFDVVGAFLAMSDIARWGDWSATIAASLAQLRPGGLVVLADAFPEAATSAREELGFRLHEAVGYRYVSMVEAEAALVSNGVTVEGWRFYGTGRPALDAFGVQAFLRDECGFCELDGSSVPPWTRVWADYRQHVEACGGAAIDSKIGVLFGWKAT